MEDIFDSAWCSQQKFAGIYRNALLSLDWHQLEIWIVAYWIESYIIYSVSMGSFFHPPFIWLYLHFLNYWFGLYMKKEKYIVFCSVKSGIFFSLSLSFLSHFWWSSFHFNWNYQKRWKFVHTPFGWRKWRNEMQRFLELFEWIQSLLQHFSVSVHSI